ncbi:MAG: hypothetical protein KC933_38040, partial [Myxococcales bacterium]|nr:hypothetical protein [Myxococcales bacterium]
MPAPVQPRHGLTFIPALGAPKRGLDPIPGPEAGAAELKALLAANWPAVARGTRPQLSQAEAAWLTELANHPSADRALHAEIAARAAEVPMTDSAKRAGFDRFLGELAAPPQPAPGPVIPPVQPGGIGDRPVDIRVGRDFNRAPPASGFTVDLAKAQGVWHSEYNKVSDLFTTKTALPNGMVIEAPSHMMGQAEADLRIIAYDDADGPNQKDIARFIAPGEIAIAIKHHAPHPDADEKERMKLQCTHIEIAVGVDTPDGPGAITINNPQNYQQGLFGTPDYPMIFVKPTFPEGLSNEEKMAYVDNIRTWLVIANTFTNFPGNYNGGDPLATRGPEQVKALGDKLLAALSGDQEARAWLNAPENQVYCAELAHVALNLGIHVPLNEATLGADRFAMLKGALRDKAFLQNNDNQYADLVKLKTAPAGMKPMTEKLGLPTSEPGEARAFGQGLAIQPYTVADILEEFIQATVPREQMGEPLAAVQAEILKKAQDGLYEATGIDQLPAASEERKGVDKLYDALVATVGKQYGSYAEFRGALKPLMIQARAVVNPRGNGKGAFVPPSCYLTRATESITGQPTQGVLGW